MRSRFSILFALVFALLMAVAAEGQQLFSDFPINGQISAFQVSAGYSTSNSFTLASGGTVGEVVFGAWVSSGDSVTGATWSIGTTPFDTSLGTGTAGATSAYDSTNVDGFDVNTVSFPIPGVTLPAGTYYLTISNAVSASGNPVYWDINNAAGVDAWSSAYGHVSAPNTCFLTIGISGTCASSFELEGTSMALTAMPSSVGFANQTVNTTSTSQPVTITNTGSGTVTISGIAITGTNPGDFAQTNNCPLSPATLASLGTCTINVTFTPLAANPRAAAITLTGSSPLSIGVNGTGIALPASQLAFSTEPPAMGMPETVLGTVVVKVEDADGNLVPGSSAQVTISSTPAGVSGTLTANAVNGIAIFNDLLFTASGTYTLTASSSGLNGTTSTSITIGGHSPTSQYIFGSQAEIAVPTAAQSWTGLMPIQSSLWQNNATTGDTYALMPTTGTFSSLCVNLTTAPGAGASWIWTLYKNGSDQPITVTISGAQKQACDMVDSTGFVPGDLVALHVTPSAGPAPASAFASWYIVQTPQVPGETILFGSQQAGSAQYLSFAGNSTSLSTEPAMETIIPAAGTVTKYIAEYVGTGSSVKAVLNHNQSATALSASLTSGAFVQQTGSLSVSAGDVFDVNETGITATSALYASIVFVPNVPGQFVIPTIRDTVSNADPLYYLVVSGRSTSPLQTTEANAQQIGGNVQIQGIYAQSLAAPGSGAQYAFTLRDNKANTTLNTTLSGSNLTACTTSTPVAGCATASAVSVNNLDLLDTSVVPTGSTAGTTVNISYLAYVPQLAFATQPPAAGTFGTALSPVVVQLQDNNGNAITGSTAQVTISSSPAGVSGTLTVNAVNGVATFNNLVFNSSSGTYSLIASVGGLTPVTSSPISISGGSPPVASLSPALSFPNTTSETTSAALAATLSNTGGSALNNIVPSIGGTNPGDFAIATGANACGATLAAGSSCSIYVTFTPASVASFSAMLSVADSASGSPQTVSLTGTGIVSVLVFTTGPTAAGTAGTPLSSVVVEVQDGSGNLETGSSAQITISSTPAGVSGTLTATAVNGVATFNNLVFAAAGSYTLSAASSGLTGVTSGSITIYASRPTSQYIFGTQSNSTVPTASQSWIGFMPRNEDLWAATPADGSSYALMPTTGTLSSLCVNLTAAPGAGASWTWALYKNGADQSISVTISGSQTQACDLVDTTGFVPGDLVALHVTPSASPAPAAANSSWYIVQTPVVPGETILFASMPLSGSYDMALGGNGSGYSIETAMATIIPTAGTVTKYIAEYAGTGSSVAATLNQNESATPLSVPLATSGGFVQQTGNLTVSPGDVFDVSETGITGSSAFYASVVFVPNVPGQFVIPSYRNGEVNNSATTYFALTGRSTDNFQPTESLAQQIGGSVQIQGIFARTTVAPGSGAQWSYTLRDNGANTSLNTTTSGTNFTSCTTSAPVTGCLSGSPVTVNNLDLLDTAVTPTGSPALSEATNGVAVSYLAYMPQLAFSTEPPATGTAGTALSPVVVQVEDANGNPLTGSTASVTISSSPSGVGGTLTVNAVNGVATFSNLQFTTAGGYTLSASASGLVTVTSSSISISGGSAPVASLSPALSFPNTASGTTSSALAATLSNTGNGALNNIVPSIGGTNPGDFAISTGANACGATLAAGSSCSIYVTFTPASATSFSATLSVADSATGSPQTVSLMGTGTAPVASLSPALSFPNALTGTTSSALAATLSNTGNGALNNIVPSITGTNPGDFAIATGANACGATLAAGSSCSIYVTFTPASAASFSATLSVADNASGSPQTVALSGTGTAALSSTSQYIFGSQAEIAVPTAAQSWTGLMPIQSSLWQNNATTGDTYALMPTTGTFSSLCVNLTTAPGAGASWIWTLYKNGSDQPITVTISGAQKQACDMVDSTGFVPGDLVALHVTPSAGPAPASAFASWYIVQTPQVPGETILFGSQQAGSAQYLSFAGNSTSLSTEPAMETIIPAAGTVTKYIAEYVGTGSSVKAVLNHNQSATALSASLTSGAFVQQTGSLSVSAGDVFDVNETGITATSALYASIVFVPNVPGQFVIPTIRDAVSNADPLYYLVVSGRSTSPLQTTEANAQQIGGNVQIQGIYAQSLAAPGSGAQYAFTLRDNKANTTLNTTLSGSNLTACTTSTPVAGCATASAVSVNNLDLLDTSVVPTGSTAGTTVNISYLAYVPQLAFTTQPPAAGTFGTALSPVVVQLQDNNGNAITGSTAQVTISSSPAGVSGTLTVNAVNGVATFNNLVFNSSSGTYSLIASVGGLTPVTSSPISISGGTGPVASLSPALSFPNTASGTTSSALAATLSNTGGGALNNIVPSITGTNPGDFALTTGANACGATLAAGSSCSIYVTFTPASATSFSATLSVADSASGSPQTVSLMGTGTAPVASLSPALSFPNTLTGTTSSALAATLSNTGNGALNNIVPSITGTNPGDFAISTGVNACGATLAAGSSCSIYVTFTPASATSFSATLSVADSASGSPQTVALGGTGTAALSSTSQYIFGSQAEIAVPAAAQSWTGLMPIQSSLWQNNATTGDTYALMPTTGTFSSLCVNLTTAPGAGASWIWTLYKNGSDQPITVTISGAQKQACDLVDSTGFVPGDMVALHVTPSAGPAPASTFASWYIVQTPQVPGETILFGSQQAGSAQYLSFAGNSTSLSTEPAMETIIPAAGTVTKYIAEYVGTGSSVKAVLNHNQSATALSASLTSGAFVQQTGNLSVSAGDVFDVNETGITATSALYASIVFVPNVPGQFVIPTIRDAVSNADPLYYLVVSGRSTSPLQTTEANAQQIGGNVQIQGIYAQSLAAPGSGAQYAFTLRDNGTNTALSATLSGANLTACATSVPVTGCATGSAVTVNNLDLLDTSVVPTGSTAATTVNISYLAYVP